MQDASPRAIFSAWLASQPGGGAAAFEALLREHPAQAAELRSLSEQHEALEATLTLEDRGLAGSLSERLEQLYGPGVDPRVELEGEEEGDFTEELLGRLSDRTPSSLRYRLKGEVAQGGMGAVLRVWDEDLRRHLAMKVMLRAGDGDAPPAAKRPLARFLEEAQVTGQLDHPGIVPVHEMGLDPKGRAFFTMKLVKGRTLGEVFEQLAAGTGEWSRTQVLNLLLRVCEAMSYAHAKSVIHRDLKPANVMVGRFGEVYVMDWGLAKILGREDEKDLRIRPEPLLTSELLSDRHEHADQSPDSPLHTMDGDVVGTPAYMPPEQAAGRIEEMGPHSDVYALGAMLYQLLAGHMPFVPRRARVNNYAIWQRVQEGPPLPLAEVARDAPAELVAICEKAMAREPRERYPDMAGLSADLSAFVEGRVVRAYETGAWAEARKWVRRNKVLATSLAAAVALLAIGLVSSLLLKAQSDANAQLADANAQQSDAHAQRADAKAREARSNERRAEENLARARESEAEARAQRDRAEAETAKVLRLSDVKRLQELVAQADALWPAHPDKIPDLESWLDRAESLLSKLAVHRATLTEMRAEASERTPEGPANEVQALTGQAESRRAWSFGSPEEQWQHDVLAELIDQLEGLEAGLFSGEAISAEQGWSVPRRLSFARELESGFAEGGAYATAWAAALPAIHETYPGLDLKPQMGLVPLGPDPESGLWEFAHLMTGDPPERDADARLILTEAMSVVLVLIPEGSYWMGAQSTDPNGRNYHPSANDDEGPVHEVELSAFLLSKYEMTQGQWMRLASWNPSQRGPHRWNSEWFATSPQATLLQPVEQMDWRDCMVWLPRAGLILPSEAQWEFGGRGSTETPWWTGIEKETLAGVANLSDSYAQRHGITPGDFQSWLDDGAIFHAPVGTYAANPFGLHETAGNLWELCLDGYYSDFYAASPFRDPVAPWQGAPERVTRGGGYNATAFFARSTFRSKFPPTRADPSVGLRPARSLEP